LIRTDPEPVGNVCKLGGTSMVTEAVGAFSSLGVWVIFAGGAVAVFDIFWLDRRRFCQMQRIGFLRGF